MSHPSTVILKSDTVTPTEKIHLSKEEFDRLPSVAKGAIEASGIPLTLSATVPHKTFSVATASVDKSQNLAKIVNTIRCDFGDLHGEWLLFLNWDVISAQTAVFVAIGQGAPGGPKAGKLIGAPKFTLFNVAPRAGGVDIWVSIDSPTDVRVYVDYLIVTVDVFFP